jgi:CRP-like cAMP-binding protein
MPEQLPAIFEGLPHNHLLAAMMQFQRLEMEYGAALMEEGDEDASLICILEGEVEIKTGKVDLGRAGPGQIIGEMALFGSGLRTATVKTVSDCTFLMLDRAGYESLRDKGNPIAHRLEDIALQQLVGRLRDINKRIGKLSEGTRAAAATPNAGILRNLARLFGGGGGRGFAFGVDPVAVLKKSSLFEGASDAALAEVGARFSKSSFSTGHFICTQGEYGHEMFIVASGLVEVLMAVDDTKVEPLATLDVGDAFGMASVIEDVPRMASCVAKERSVCLSLGRDEFRKLIAQEDAAGSAMRIAVIKSMTDQLAYANGQLALLDLERRQKTGEFTKSLLRANAGVEAHGRHLQEKGEGEE